MGGSPRRRHGALAMGYSAHVMGAQLPFRLGPRSSVERASCADELPVDLVVQLFAADTGRCGYLGAALCGHAAHLEPVLDVLSKDAVPDRFRQFGGAAVEGLDGSLNA